MEEKKKEGVRTIRVTGGISVPGVIATASGYQDRISTTAFRQSLIWSSESDRSSGSPSSLLHSEWRVTVKDRDRSTVNNRIEQATVTCSQGAAMTARAILDRLAPKWR